MIENKVFSQNGEDGVIENLILSIYDDPYKKLYVEIGCGDGTECNTRYLREQYDWFGILIDASYENSGINLIKSFVTKENVVGLLAKNLQDSKANLLSLDIDYNDFYIMHSILQHYKFDIIVCEYNSTHAPNEDKVVIYEPEHVWRGSNYFGASLMAYCNLMDKFNYTLVYTESKGINAFFVHNSLVNKCKFSHIGDVQKLYNAPRYGKYMTGHRKDKQNRKYISSKTILEDVSKS